MLESRQQNSRPPLLVGERAVWLGSGSGLPQGGFVRWVGKLQGMGPGWTVGVELDQALPYGGIDGSWCGRKLFQCRTKHGLLVPASVVVKEDALIRTFGISPAVINKPPAPNSSTESSTPNQKPISKPKRTKHSSGSRPTSQQANGSKKEVEVLPTCSSSASNSVPKRKNKLEPPSQLPPQPSPKARRKGASKQKSALADDADKSVSIASSITETEPKSVIEKTGTNKVNEQSGETVNSPQVDSSIVTACDNTNKEKSVNDNGPITDENHDPDVSIPETNETSTSEPLTPITQRRHGKSALPPAKPGYFHTAPARPNRHLRGKKQAPVPNAESPAEPDNDQEENPQVSSLPTLPCATKENSQRDCSEEETPAGPPCVPLRRHNSLNGPRSTDNSISTKEELIYQWFDAVEAAPTAPPRYAKSNKQQPPMNSSQNTSSPPLSTSSSTSSFEDAIAAAEAIYTERIKKQFGGDSASSISSNSSSQQRKSGGFLSFLRWLRRGGGSESSEEKVNELSRAGSTNSLGTVVSAASSFAYIGPNALQLNDNRASLHFAPNPTESDTYRHRIKQRDHARRLDKNITFKQKYKLNRFACSRETLFSGTLKPTTPVPSGASSTGSGRRSRKRPAPPIPQKSEHYTDCSLPATLVHHTSASNMEATDLDKPTGVKMHRRTASESSKEKRAGAYCHVKGKRKAPQPPAVNNKQLSKFKNPFPSFGRKKRQAPLPPENIAETSTKLSEDEKNKLISNINRLRASGKNDAKNQINRLHGPALVTAPPIVLNPINVTESKPAGIAAPLSPKPWYKRSSNKVTKLEKPLKSEDEMPDVSYVRKLPSPDSEGKRKSLQLSMLPNISELDREAAEIVQNQQRRAAEMIAARNNSFYLPASPKPTERTPEAQPSSSNKPDAEPHQPESPEPSIPKPQTKSLISMFNAITNVSKVTVNTSTAALAGLFNGELRKNRMSQTFSVVEEQDEEDSTSEPKVTNVPPKDLQPAKSPKPDKSAATKAKQDSDTKALENKNVLLATTSSAVDDKNTGTNNETGSNDKGKIKNSIYPRLSSIVEPVKEVPKEPPLPLSIAGVPDGVTLSRQKRIVWVCPRCTLENPRWRLTCDACEMWRPSSIHEEGIVPVADKNIHALPPDTGDQKPKESAGTNQAEINIDDFKRPEPIGPIDWETEIQKYFEPNKAPPKIKSPEPKRKVSPLLTSKVEEAIKILEGKQKGFEEPAPAKVAKTIITPPVAKNNEPEYAKINANKSKVSTPVNTNITTKPAGNIGNASSVSNTPPQKSGAGNTKTASSSAQVKVPDTFIGGRTKTDEKVPIKNAAVTQTCSNNKITPTTEPDKNDKPKILTKEDVDEVRKARLAFFNKPSDSTDSSSSDIPPSSPRLTRMKQTPGVSDPGSPRAVRTAETATDTKELLQITKTSTANTANSAAEKEEKMKLREKLKEMKNSLPKHAHSPDYESRILYPQSKIPETIKEGKEPPIEVSMGAIKKSPENAGFVKKAEPPYANLKGRRLLNKAPKVSTSVQTGITNLTAKPRAEDPPIQSGKIHTTLTKSPSFRGTGTFELIGARDFATIEATKSQQPKVTSSTSTSASGAPPLQHVYANIPSPGLVQETKNVPVPGSTPAPITSVAPVPVVAAPVAAPVVVRYEATVTVPPPNQVVVEVEKKPLEQQEEDDFLDDLSMASGTVESMAGDTSDVEKLAGLLTGPKGIADFKAEMAASPQQQSSTLAVNRLLRRLEGAIANGQHRIAAGLARDLARLKVNCSVIRQRKIATIEPELFTVDMFVEDKVSHQGPIPLSVHASMTVGDLKVKVEQEFEIPAAVQRWILGKQLASDDNRTLQEHSVSAAGCTVYLYLVAPPDRADSSSPSTNPEPSAPIMTPPPVVETRMVPTVEPPRGPGWYYNFEEDRYSYCESSDEDDVSEPEVVQRPPEMPPAPAKAVPGHIPPAHPPTIQLAQDEGTDSEEEEEEDDDPAEEAAGGLFPTAPPGTLPPENKTGTLMLGWRCPVCTLINSPTRPGCAACTTERPGDYRVPQHYETSETEVERLKKEEYAEKNLENEGEAAGGGVPRQDNYAALLALDNTDLVSNVETFECSVCLAACLPGEGAVLRECLHAFCRACLAHTAQFSEEVEVRCPFRNQQYACDAALQEREVRALVPAEVYERMQAKSVAQAENKIKNAFHCKTPDCRGWCIFEDNVNDFRCPVCGHHNCLTCQVIHDGLNCKQFQERVTQASETDAEAKRTKDMLEDMVRRGEALACPTCQVVLMKKWGCDWLRCSMCRTEICWVTRGPRWGPGGKGDTTGGCKCGINGIKCHPKCNYCH